MEKTMRTNAASVLLEMLTMNEKSFSTTSEELLDKFLHDRRMDFKIGAMQRIVAAAYSNHSQHILFKFIEYNVTHKVYQNIPHEKFKCGNCTLIIEPVATNSLICTFIMEFKN